MSKNKMMRKIDFLFLMVFALSFLTLGVQYVNRAVDTGWHDTGWYLKNAIQIHENGGIPGFVKGCWTGTYREANQHPLYLLILSLFASRNLDFFAKAKMVSLSIGLLTLVVLYILALSLYGRTVAILSTILMEFNFYFLRESSHVAAEILLILTSLLAWYFIIQGFKNNKCWLVGGMFSGLAYFSKGSGIFFLFIFALAALLIRGFSIFKNKYFYSFFLAFVLISFPLLWRNTVVYHNPIYNINSHVMWLDNWKQTYDPTYAEQPPNMITYFKTHTFAGASKRLLKGLKSELFILFDSLKMIGYLQWFYIGSFLGFWALLGFFLDREKRRQIVTFLFIGFFFLFFAWYNPIVADSRFILPLVPVLLIFASVGLEKGIRKIAIQLKKEELFQNEKWRLFVYIFIIVFLLGFPAKGILSQGLQNPVHSYKTAPGYEILLHWLQENVHPKDKYILWPAHTYWFNWYASISGQSVAFPEVANFQKFEKFLKQEKITYIIIHAEMLLERNNILGNYFALDSLGGIHQIKPIGDWTEICRPSMRPIPFLIFRLNGRKKNKKNV